MTGRSGTGEGVTALVIGAAGQVGGALLEALDARGERAVGTVSRVARAGCDVFDLAAAGDDPSIARDLLARHRPAVVLIAAGLTHVDRCEDEPDLARRINRDGPAALAAAARGLGARTVYYSTEYVFDGAGGPYREDDPPAAVSVYGESKLAGELAVAAADPDALILRTTVVYGPEQQGKNFCYQLAARLGAGERMRVPDDQVSTPTYNRDLAAATLALLDRGSGGVVHVAGPDCIDRATFARRVAARVGLDPSRIDAVPTSSLGQRARRPLRAGLATGRLEALGLALRGVEAAVDHWLAHPGGRPWLAVAGDPARP
jgi:dTDP-4-dehydrorhamnose reductase